MKLQNHATTSEGEPARFEMITCFEDGRAYACCRIAMITIVFGNAIQVFVQALLRVDVLMAKACKTGFRRDLCHLVL